VAIVLFNISWCAVSLVPPPCSCHCATIVPHCAALHWVWMLHETWSLPHSASLASALILHWASLLRLALPATRMCIASDQDACSQTWSSLGHALPCKRGLLLVSSLRCSLRGSSIPDSHKLLRLALPVTEWCRASSQTCSSLGHALPSPSVLFLLPVWLIDPQNFTNGST
jgi:hypothetical protein